MSEPAKEQPKKKKRVVVTPPCPPEVATAYLILRGVVLGVLGVDMNDANLQVSLLQPTYLKEKRPCAKVSFNLGKKYGMGQVPLPEEASQQQELLQVLEKAANRLIQEDREIQMATTTKGDAVQQYGAGILDASHKKLKDNDTVTLAWMDDLVVCLPPGIPYTNTCFLKKISIEVSEDVVMSSGMVCGKKARKAELTLKYTVQVSEQQGEVATPTSPLPTLEQVQSLQQATIRLDEGNVWLQRQEKAQEEALAQALAQQTALADDQATTDEPSPKKDEMVVNAFEVSGKIDYTQLVDKFGSKLLTENLLQRLDRHSRLPLHRFLRRDIFFSHRDFGNILDCLDQQVPMYLYTGRGPSSSAMHLGHLVPFLFTQWLQEALDIPLVIQMTDDEKFLFKGNYDEVEGDNLNHFRKLTLENARDIIACGFNPDKTFLFSDMDYVGRMYPNIVRIWKAVTTNTVNGIFGFDGTSNIGKVAFPAIQAAPSFASSFPTVLEAQRDSDMACLIPCAIDQDPYFRMTRDVAHKLVRNKQHKLGGKPALIHSKFFPPLQGAEGKMSSSEGNSAVFLTDTPEEIERKIKEHAFSGGRDTKKLQQEMGADLEVDVSYQWLRFFLEDDEELERIGKDYGSGSGEYWSTGKVKEKLISVLQELVAAHQERRAKITDEEIIKWMSERSIL